MTRMTPRTWRTAEVGGEHDLFAVPPVDQNAGEWPEQPLRQKTEPPKRPAYDPFSEGAPARREFLDA